MLVQTGLQNCSNAYKLYNVLQLCSICETMVHGKCCTELITLRVLLYIAIAYNVIKINTAVYAKFQLEITFLVYKQNYNYTHVTSCMIAREHVICTSYTFIWL